MDLPPRRFLVSYCWWWGCTLVCWAGCWLCGQTFSVRMAKRVHEVLVRRLMRAPIDRFYDHTPVGSIMNRFASDMFEVDMGVYLKCGQLMGLVWAICAPLLYVHAVMPIWFTLTSIPFYYLLARLLRLYWCTMVQLIRLSKASKSS